MHRSRLTLALAAAGAVVATAAVCLDGTAAAAAAPRCNAWAAMPARVSLTARETVVHATLRGDSGCRAETFENGATATLYGPRGEAPYDQRWRHFNTAQSIEITVGITRSGTYRMGHGDVQLYDANSVRVPSRWVATTMQVNNGASVTVLRHSARVVTGRARHYSTYGWVGSNAVPVSLQERVGGGWRTVATTRADRDGHFSLRAHAGGGSYRVLAAQTTTYWSAAAAVH